MLDAMTIRSLLDAIERYFDLMFDSDVTRFDEVFADSAQLHGLREGRAGSGNLYRTLSGVSA